jgi:hypothetical protein
MFLGMEQMPRFQLRLPVVQRRELAMLARETGVSSADLVRLGIRYMLQHPEVVSRPLSQNRIEGGAQ